MVRSSFALHALCMLQLALSISASCGRVGAAIAGTEPYGGRFGDRAPPDCGENVCSVGAYCAYPEGLIRSLAGVSRDCRPSQCMCMPGTIDPDFDPFAPDSDGFWVSMSGTTCKTTGWTIRYVMPMNILKLMQHWNIIDEWDVTNPSAELPMTLGYLMCLPNMLPMWPNETTWIPNNEVARGYYLRTVPNWQTNPLDPTEEPVFEVNCLYENKPERIPSWFDVIPEITSFSYLVPPAIYTWELPTTDAPVRISATGLIVDSVHFKTDCSESGCWVIKGTMTTGEGFNAYEALNTFYLPQADITAEHPQGDLSYDFDYGPTGSNVEWTFEPARNPCTSANYQAGTSDIDQVSTCCINDPENDDNGGFVANYRPTTRFVAWAEKLRCDDKFTSATGAEKCWKVYDDRSTFDQAQATCMAAGGDLVTVANEAENTRLKDLLLSYSVRRAWIGLKSKPAAEMFESLADLEYVENITDSTFFEWVNETMALEYANWHPEAVDIGSDTGTDWGDEAREEFFYIRPPPPFGETGVIGCTTFGEWLSEQEDLPSLLKLGLSFLLGTNIQYYRTDIQSAMATCTGQTARVAMIVNNGRSANAGKWVSIPQGLERSAQTFLPGFACEFPPPSDCVAHVVQRPNYAAPPPKPLTCLEGHTGRKNWTDAAASCAAMGGHLASPKDAEDNFFLRRVAKQAGLHQRAAYWIGLHLDNAAWRWDEDDAEALSFTAWKEFDYFDFSFFRLELYAALFGDTKVRIRCLRRFFGVCRSWQTETLEDQVKASVLAALDEAEIVFNSYGYGSGTYGFLSSTVETNALFWLEPIVDIVADGLLDEFAPDDFEEGGFTIDKRGCAGQSAFDSMWHKGNCSDEREYICEVPRANAGTCHSDEVVAQDDPWDIPFPLQYQGFLTGQFKGMTASPGVVDVSPIDPFLGQYSFQIELDEVELRSRAGILRGTVGVEHSVDTFLGLLNMRPTGMRALDTFATQTNIHLEKTSFFSVSTHGENEYTFLEYVNMRLLQVLDEDKDFSGSVESDARTVRTDQDEDAAYVQVTFTMGSQYAPNLASGGLVPLDSVRVGLGTFFDDEDSSGGLVHICSQYDAADADTGELTGLSTDGLSQLGKDYFEYLIGQGCGPQALMCKSPSSVPDAFVSFNIPLGFDVFDGRATEDLSWNVFVDFVVNALDTTASTGAASQMKTTLTASIPIVEGGINIFCDGVTAKTDLKDVADVDIIVGSANSVAELSRLRIITDVASTQLSEEASAQIDTPSIEAALMTLVLKGEASYFNGTGRNTLRYTMELDDVITIHLMEDGTASTGPKDSEVQRLLSIGPDDNSDSNGLDTDGYALNGAFYFDVNRGAGVGEPLVSLEPSAALLEECPFNPTPPTVGMALESCITRRDVRARSYPARLGAVPTAMEVLAAPTDYLSNEAIVEGVVAALGAASDEADFMAGILGDSTTARSLANSFSQAIHATYALNGRYRRAYWINPGYEWTAAQMAGASIFSVSQKVYLFALVTLDENWDTVSRRRSSPRRMLLQSTAEDALQENAAGVNAASVSVAVTPKSLLAAALEVPQDRVAVFRAELQLTEAEACLTPLALQAAMRSTLEDLFTRWATPFLSLQVTRLEVDRAGVQCPAQRRTRSRALLNSFSAASASVELLVAFAEGSASRLNMQELQQMPGVVSLEAIDVSSSIPDDPDFSCSGNGCGKQEPKDEGSSSSNTALIAGIAGGVGGAVLVAAGAALWMRSRNSEAEAVPAVQAVNMDSLKAQLAEEV